MHWSCREHGPVFAKLGWQFRNYIATRFHILWLRVGKKKSTTSKLNQVINAIRQYQRKYLCFLNQHEPVQKAIVDKWPLSYYLKVMGNFTNLNIIQGDATQQ